MFILGVEKVYLRALCWGGGGVHSAGGEGGVHSAGGGGAICWGGGGGSRGAVFFCLKTESREGWRREGGLSKQTYVL